MVPWCNNSGTVIVKTLLLFILYQYAVAVVEEVDDDENDNAKMMNLVGNFNIVDYFAAVSTLRAQS